MSRKCFISYSHRLDQEAVGKFQSDFGDEWSAFIDKSIRDDVGDLADSTIKSKLSTLIKDSTVTIILVGAETGGRWWIDWEIKNSLRKSEEDSSSLSFADSLPFLGRIATSNIFLSSIWLEELWNPLSKLQIFKLENVFCAFLINGTAILSSVVFSITW